MSHVRILKVCLMYMPHLHLHTHRTTTKEARDLLITTDMDNFNTETYPPPGGDKSTHSQVTHRNVLQSVLSINQTYTQTVNFRAFKGKLSISNACAAKRHICPFRGEWAD